MQKRREMKKSAVIALKRHYLIYVVICLISIYVGSEFVTTTGAMAFNVIESRIKDSTHSVVIGGLDMGHTLQEVVDHALSGNVEEGRRISDDMEEKAIANEKNVSPAFGRSRGVLAQLVNDLTSGSVFVTIAATVNSILGSTDILRILYTLSGFLLPLFLWFFLKNMYVVISRRMFMEGRTYEKVPFERFLFLLRVRRWVKTSWTMCVVSVFQVLWSLTIVGGIIKHYSYYLVPYILAENPDADTLEAITLSRKMMQGHKWQCFVFEISFIGWYILGAFTLGLSEIFFSNPYRVAAFTEYYVQLRALAKANSVENAQLLNDRYLYEAADLTAMYKAYGDVFELMSHPVENLESLQGIRKILADWFGVLVARTPREYAYEASQAEQSRIDYLSDEIHGLEYPERLFPLTQKEMEKEGQEDFSKRKASRREPLHYMRNYSIWSLILMFFIFAVFGWLWEVSLHLITNGEFVNRGVSHGPWLPIYGSGALMILVLLKKLRTHPVWEFVSIVVLCGTVEYFTSYVLELLHDGQKWWDYSGYFLNLHGRICAEGLLVFGLGGLMIVYVIGPLLDNMLRKIDRKILIPICILLLLVFLADQIYSSQVPNTGEGVSTVTAPAVIEEENYFS